ncbi:MAG: apolipoprotein N-acyltransferase, partial [Candidatus Sericytochromatia bacterium]
YEKWSMNPEKSFDIYLDETNKALNETKDSGKTDLIVWTESAIPVLLDNPNFTQRFKDIAINNNAHFITGVFESKGQGDSFEIFNSMAVIDPKGSLLGTYYKRHLVPFGEYLPFGNLTRRIFPVLSKLNALDSDVIAGEKVGIFETSFGKVGSIICYESIFPEIVSSNITYGAELIAISTNDSWYKDSSAVYQHNAQAVLRAIENDRFIIRAANTGISSIIDNKGNIIDSIPPLESGYIFDKVSFIKTRTLYSYIGDIPIVLFSLLSIFFLSKKRNTKIL